MEDVSLRAVTVSQVNAYVKDKVAGDENLKNLAVIGELSNFTHHKSGHFYFTLKDEKASLRCIMFRALAAKVRFEPRDGMKVILVASVTVYERDGSVQLSVSEIHPDGVGDLQLAFEQLKQKLEKEGLFDPQLKKPLPAYPKVIGVVTSKTGAALQDILQILQRRYPLCTVRVFPALVQGDTAPESIIRAIRAADADRELDVLIVGRGGGSAEDLWCFNDEGVARAMFACKVPVISAVGHEVDFTIADFVADLRAPTPSAAAELATPQMEELLYQIKQCYRRIGQSTRETYRRRAEQVKLWYARLQAASPEGRLQKNAHALELLQNKMQRAMEQRLIGTEHRLQQQTVRLESLSPLKVLTRGYSITMRGQTVIDSAQHVEAGDELMIRFADGAVRALALQVSYEEENKA